MVKINVSSVDELPQVARAILDNLEGRLVVLLHAPMGAGKTTLVRAIAHELGSEDVVSSPTFAIVNEYLLAGGESFFHFDMYRIETLKEAIDMGFEEYMHSGALCFIEWPENVEDLLPEDAMLVKIEAPAEGERVFIIE